MEKIKVILIGSTGMIGKGVLYECLDDERISEVLVVNRSPLGMQHPKLKEALLKDFSDPSSIKQQLQGYDAVYFCLGVSAADMKEEDYHKITYAYTLAFAELFKALNPNGTFIYVSGVGTDSSEQGRAMWARVKGKTENDLLKLFPEKGYMFRPGMIRPLKGIKSRTKLYQTMYTIIKPFWGLVKLLMGNNLTDTVRIGKAMINVSLKGYEKPILLPPDINACAIAQE